jgi:hypothetical protein
MSLARYCFAHGQLTLHWRTEAGTGALPAAFTDDALGAEALALAGPRARRVARWDAAGWSNWWRLLEQIADGRPAVVAIPLLEGAPPVPESFPLVFALPPSVAVRAAGDLPRGVALYLGAWFWEVAPFRPDSVETPVRQAGGLEPLYRQLIARAYQEERRALLPVEVPLYHRNRRLDLGELLSPMLPHLGKETVLLSGEDKTVLDALEEELERRGVPAIQVDPLIGLERLTKAGGALR